MLNHPSYNDIHQEIFSLPVKENGQNIFIPEDRTIDYENSFWICEPV